MIFNVIMLSQCSSWINQYIKYYVDNKLHNHIFFVMYAMWAPVCRDVFSHPRVTKFWSDTPKKGHLQTWNFQNLQMIPLPVCWYWYPWQVSIIGKANEIVLCRSRIWTSNIKHQMDYQTWHHATRTLVLRHKVYHYQGWYTTMAC